jgi:hypothetical protein
MSYRSFRLSRLARYLSVSFEISSVGQNYEGETGCARTLCYNAPRYRVKSNQGAQHSYERCPV